AKCLAAEERAQDSLFLVGQARGGGIGQGEIDERLTPRGQRARKRIFFRCKRKPHASGSEISDWCGSGSRSLSFTMKRSADQISSMEMILLSVNPPARPTARTSVSSRSVTKPELLRGQAIQSEPRGASTCFAWWT